MANSVVKLSIDSQEYDAKLKSASKALSDYFDIAKKGDRTFEVLDKGVLEAVQAIGKMETQTKSAQGQLREMQNTFRDMSLVYRRLTDAEKQSPIGKELSKSLEELKGRISETKKDLQSINQELSGSKFGEFGNILDSVGRKMGVNANITELLTSKTALMYAGVGAGIAVLSKSASEWKKYNDELARQDQATTVITGLKGPEANYMTDTMRALSDTYKVDFRQAIEAANTLMSQFGVQGDEAIQLIKDGMHGMIQGDGPKLLQMIKQYAPAFRDAGVSASQLVAVIHNSEGGIFTDQNMNAIVMGMKNIRLMTKQTSEALAQLGIDGKKMSQDLNAGTITVFDALKQVAGELKNVDSNSQAAGQVMQAVFGRQGVTAGTNIAKAIETLNTNLEETKKQTGELGDAFADLQTANEKLNTAIRETFSYDGWAEMATGIKTTLLTTLAEVIEKLGEVKSLIGGLTPGQARKNKYGTGGIPDEVRKDLTSLQNSPESDREALYNQLRTKYEQRFRTEAATLQKWEQAYDRTMESSNWQGLPFVRKLGDRIFDAWHVNTSRSNVAAEEEILNLFRREAQKILNPSSPAPSNNNNNNNNNNNSYSGKKSPQQQAQAKFEQAEKDYQQALEQAALEVKAGTADTVAAKKKELSAAESLWKSVGDAREIYDSEELKKAQEDAAKKVVELGGSVNALVEEQKKAQEAARELTAAQKKAAEANRKMADALAANDYKAYTAAYKQYTAAQADVQRLQPVEVPILPKWEQTFMDALPEELKKYGSKGIEVPVSMSYTQNNLSAFINRLNEQLSQAPLGTTLYQNLTAQLADANMLANLMQTAVKNGIDIAQFDPQGLFNKIFGENPGDYIDNAKWEELRKKIEEIIGKPITIDVNTGTVNVGGKTTGSKTDGQKDFNSLINNVSNITRSLEQLGVEIPEGFAKTISIMQIISSLITTISSMTAAQGISGALSNIPIVGGVLGFFGSLFGFQNGGMVHAANGFSGIVPGNSFSGDNIPAMLNAGETVLTRAQSGVIASALNGIENGGNVSRSMATIESDQIRIVLQNGAQAKGMTLGEYLGLN